MLRCNDLNAVKAENRSGPFDAADMEHQSALHPANQGSRTFTEPLTPGCARAPQPADLVKTAGAPRGTEPRWYQAQTFSSAATTNAR